MYNYCTLFDSNYLTRGLAMYESLKKHSHKFHLYIFAFDDKSYDLIKRLKLEYVTVISLKEFEDEELLSIKDKRTKVEYCWTSTPSIIKFSLENFNLDSVTYVDADLYFFRNPSVLIEEMGSKSVMITEHRYTPEYDQSATSGIYCVQFMTFKNDERGLEVLNWWRRACLDWCYARFEDGKFGDQKYLNDWPERFQGVHILQNKWGGVAPWNIQQYDFSVENFEIIFYHFHGLKFLSRTLVYLGDYRLKKIDIKLIYAPYVKHLEQIRNYISDYISKNDNSYNYHGIIRHQIDWKTPLRYIKSKFKKSYNFYRIKDLMRL